MTGWQPGTSEIVDGRRVMVPRRHVEPTAVVAGGQKVPCLCCDRQINPRYTVCGACAEDMGYASRPK